MGISLSRSCGGSGSGSKVGSKSANIALANCNNIKMLQVTKGRIE